MCAMSSRSGRRRRSAAQLRQRADARLRIRHDLEREIVAGASENQRVRVARSRPHHGRRTDGRVIEIPAISDCTSRGVPGTMCRSTSSPYLSKMPLSLAIHGMANVSLGATYPRFRCFRGGGAGADLPSRAGPPAPQTRRPSVWDTPPAGNHQRQSQQTRHDAQRPTHHSTPARRQPQSSHHRLAPLRVTIPDATSAPQRCQGLTDSDPGAFCRLPTAPHKCRETIPVATADA